MLAMYAVFVPIFIIGGVSMSISNDDVLNTVGSPIGGIQLQLYYATARSTRFVEESSYRYISKKNASPDWQVREWFQNGILLNQVSPEWPNDYVLLVQLGGEITSVDEVLLDQLSIDRTEVRILLSITKVESPDGEPFPVEAFALLSLNETITSKQRLIITSSGYKRSVEGEITPMEGSVIETVLVEFNESD